MLRGPDRNDFPPIRVRGDAEQQDPLGSLEVRGDGFLCGGFAIPLPSITARPASVIGTRVTLTALLPRPVSTRSVFARTRPCSISSAMTAGPKRSGHFS